MMITGIVTYPIGKLLDWLLGEESALFRCGRPRRPGSGPVHGRQGEGACMVAAQLMQLSGVWRVPMPLELAACHYSRLPRRACSHGPSSIGPPCSRHTNTHMQARTHTLHTLHNYTTSLQAPRAQGSRDAARGAPGGGGGHRPHAGRVSRTARRPARRGCQGARPGPAVWWPPLGPRAPPCLGSQLVSCSPCLPVWLGRIRPAGALPEPSASHAQSRPANPSPTRLPPPHPHVQGHSDPGCAGHGHQDGRRGDDAC